MESAATTADDLRAAGLVIRGEVVGGEQVRDGFAGPLQDLVLAYCWGTVWARDGLERRLRSLITVSMLLALGKQQELTLHMKGAMRVGWTEQELREVVVHAAAYCGIPASLEGMRCLKAAIAEMAEQDGGLSARSDTEEGRDR